MTWGEALLTSMHLERHHFATLGSQRALHLGCFERTPGYIGEIHFSPPPLMVSISSESSKEDRLFFSFENLTGSKEKKKDIYDIPGIPHF